jgi:outer membrane biosynthesis protein TonB
MAKSRVVDAPPKNDIYFGMWLCALLASVFAIAVLAIECTEYGWDSKAPLPSASNTQPLPRLEMPAAATEGTANVIDDLQKPVLASDKPEAKPEEPKPAPVVPPPAPIPSTVLSQKPEATPQPAKPAEPKVEEKKAPVPASAPAGPIPGFQLPNRNR